LTGEKEERERVAWMLSGVGEEKTAVISRGNDSGKGKKCLKLRQKGIDAKGGE